MKSATEKTRSNMARWLMIMLPLPVSPDPNALETDSFAVALLPEGSEPQS